MAISLHFNKMTKLFLFILSVCLVVIIGFIDYITGTEISFSIFYLIPITFAAYKIGKNEGLAISLLSAVIWLACDIIGNQNYSNSAIPYWNAFVRLSFFVFIVYLISYIKKLNVKLENNVQIRTQDLENEIKSHQSTVKELERKSYKLSHLAKRIQSIKEVENKKMAREIHDELGQLMTTMKIDIYWILKKYSNDNDLISKLTALSETVDESLISIRELSKKLRPRFLDELGLIAAMEWQLKDFQSRTGINTDFKTFKEELNLRNSISDALFRIFQEAITNVARHSKATNVAVCLQCNGDGKIKMMIADNGVGLPRDYFDKENSLGILGMKERAKLAGGSLIISSGDEDGTKIEVMFPLDKKQKINI